MSDIQDYQERIAENNRKLGWYDDGRTVGDDVALIHSEVSEILEAWRAWLMEDKTREKCMHEHPEDSLDGSYCHPNHVCKPEGVGSECADVAIRLMDACKRWGIDLDFEIDRKITFNETRSFRHGNKNL